MCVTGSRFDAECGGCSLYRKGAEWSGYCEVRTLYYIGIRVYSLN